MPFKSREVQLIARPTALPIESDFAVMEVSVPDPEPGQFIVQNAYLGLDPFLRLYMSGPRSNHNAYPLGASPPALAVGQVIASRTEAFPEGGWAVGPLGWREFSLSRGSGIRRFDPALGDPSLALGPLGMSGLTAWAGTTLVARPQAGESLYVTAAAGAVGSLVGQIAVLRGARVLGSAGSADRVRWLRDAGFHDAFNYRERDVHDVLAEAYLDGLDSAFDNVGGSQLEAIIEALHEHGRITLCGAIGVYNEGPDAQAVRNTHLIFMKSLRLQGFRWRDYPELWDEFGEQMSGWLKNGAIVHRQHFIEGIEQTPRAFAMTFTSDAPGKTMIRLPAADRLLT